MCSSGARQALIEGAVDDGASLDDVAERFGISLQSLTRHIASHPRASKTRKRLKAESSPAAGKRRAPVATRAPRPPPPKPKPAEAATEEEAPPTTRSPEKQKSAREQIDALITTVRSLLERANKDTDSTYAERSSLVRTALAAIRLQANLSGELGASEVALTASPQWQRLLGELLEALKPYPDAARAVLARLESVEIAAA